MLFVNAVDEQRVVRERGGGTEGMLHRVARERGGREGTEGIVLDGSHSFFLPITSVEVRIMDVERLLSSKFQSWTSFITRNCPWNWMNNPWNRTDQHPQELSIMEEQR